MLKTMLVTNLGHKNSFKNQHTRVGWNRVGDGSRRDIKYFHASGRKLHCWWSGHGCIMWNRSFGWD